MNPTQYVERESTYTACQWDGSTESADWIVEAYQGAAARDGDDLVVQGPVHRRTLPQGMWVVRENHADASAIQADDETFHRFYREQS